MNRLATAALLAVLALVALVALGPASAANDTGRIMFVGGCAAPCAYSGGEGIFVIHPDGSGLTRLASGTGAWWSPDGTRLAFVRHGRGGGQDVYLVNADGSGEVRLTTGLSTREQSLSAGWSPDGKRLAVKRSGSQRSAIFVISARDGSVVKLADNARGATWSSDGSRLAYLQSREPTDEYAALFVASADGSGKHRIPLPGAVTGVAAAVWSPVGDRIAFLTSQYRLYLIDADGGEGLKLADLTVESGPVWSPAGDRLTFVAEYSGVHVVKADGSGLVQLDDLPEYASASEPVWSPDGSKLAYAMGGPADCWRCEFPLRGRQIYAFNADGTGGAALTTNGGRLDSDIAPIWSPDGTKIVFASTRVQRVSDNLSNVDLFQMNSDGTCETRLSKDLLYIRSGLAWQPHPGAPAGNSYRCVDLRLDQPYPDVDPTGGYLDRDRVYFYAPVVTNDGNLVATGVRLSYVVPDKMVLLSVEPTQGSCSGSPALVCDLGTLAPGATATVVLRFRVPEPARLGHLMSVSGNEPDNDPSYDRVDQWVWNFPFCRVVEAPGVAVDGTSDGDLICGTTHGDRIDSAAGDDDLRAGAGHDRLDAGVGADKIYADVGDDEISGGSGRDRVFSGPGDDAIHGGGDDDWAYADTGNDVLLGGGGRDKLLGGSGRDRIEGGAGADGDHGGDGNDLLEGGDGNDRIGRDSNVLHGDHGDDVVYAGAGDDLISERHGRDKIYGGSGDDTFHANDRQPDRIFCGPGRDVAIVDRLDRVHRSCEVIIRRRVPRRKSERGR